MMRLAPLTRRALAPALALRPSAHRLGGAAARAPAQPASPAASAADERCGGCRRWASTHADSATSAQTPPPTNGASSASPSPATPAGSSPSSSKKRRLGGKARLLGVVLGIGAVAVASTMMADDTSSEQRADGQPAEQKHIKKREKAIHAVAPTNAPLPASAAAAATASSPIASTSTKPSSSAISTPSSSIGASPSASSSATSTNSSASSSSSPSSPSSSSVVVDEVEPSPSHKDHASCRACRDSDETSDLNRAYRTQAALDAANAAAATQADPTATSTPISRLEGCPPCYAYSHSMCPLNRAEVGRAGWAYLHTVAAYYPDSPTKKQQAEMAQLINIFMKLYPCGYCADRSMEQLEREPIEQYVHSQKALSGWMCRAHNEVNERLGKPIFDCEFTNQRWRDGPPTGECD